MSLWRPLSSKLPQWCSSRGHPCYQFYRYFSRHFLVLSCFVSVEEKEVGVRRREHYSPSAGPQVSFQSTQEMSRGTQRGGEGAIQREIWEEGRATRSEYVERWVILVTSCCDLRQFLSSQHMSSLPDTVHSYSFSFSRLPKGMAPPLCPVLQAFSNPTSPLQQ